MLARVWQLLLKAHEEVRRAPDPAAAAEMALLRLCYAADLPGPEDALRALQEGRPPPPPGVGGGGGAPRVAASGGGAVAVGRPMPSASELSPAPRAEAAPQLKTFTDVVALIRAKNDAALDFDVGRFVRPIAFAEGVLTLSFAEKAPRDLSQRLSQRLQTWTGRRWLIEVREEESGEETAHERAKRETAELRAQVEADPFVKALLEAFPGARVSEVRTHAAPVTVEAGGDPDAPFVIDGLEANDEGD